MKRPRLFIGSSTEGLSIAYAIQENLTYTAEITVWDQGIFNLSDTTIESLINVIDNSDFGVFVFTPDDIATIRGKKNIVVRDNVLFELGLFIGKIGRKRSFIVMPDNTNFHLPTDLLGITPGKYETNRSDGNQKAATGSLSNKIREVINKLGFLNLPENQGDTTASVEKEKEKENNYEDWIEEIFIKKNYEEGIKILKKKIRYSKIEDDKVNFLGYLAYCELQLDFEKGISEYKNLIQKYPRNNISYKLYAQSLRDNNNFNEALRIIENGLMLCDKKIGLTLMKANCLWVANKKNDAIIFLSNSALKTEPLIASQLASYLEDNKDNSLALSIIMEGYKTNPKHEGLLSNFATIAFNSSDYDLSTFLFNELVILTPKSPYAWCMLGNSFYHKEIYNSALIAYERANELADEKEAWILENIGNLHNVRGLYNKAEFYLNKAKAIQEKSEYGLARLAETYKSIEEEKKKINNINTIGKEKLFTNLEVIDPPLSEVL